MKFDVEYFETVSKLSQIQRRNLLTFFLKLPVHRQLEIYKNHLALSRENHKNCEKDKFAEFSFANFFLCVSDMKRLENPKNKTHKLSEMEEQRIHEFKLSKVSSKKYKPSRIKTIVEKEFVGLISSLRNNGLSWREISSYIYKFHKKRISTAYLHRIYTGLNICEVVWF